MTPGKIVIILLAVIVTLSCSKSRKETPESNTVDAKSISEAFEKDGEQKIVERYGDQYAGKKKVVVTVKGKGADEQVVAKAIYYDNGQMQSIERFSDGVLDGESISWSNQGQIIENNIYEKGNIVKSRKFDQMGKLIYESNKSFKDNKFIKELGLEEESSLVEAETFYNYYHDGKLNFKKSKATFLEEGAGFWTENIGVWQKFDSMGNMIIEKDYLSKDKDKLSSAELKELEICLKNLFQNKQYYWSSSTISTVFEEEPGLENSCSPFEDSFPSGNLVFHSLDKSGKRVIITAAGKDGLLYTKDDIIQILENNQERSISTIDTVVAYNDQLFTDFLNKVEGKYIQETNSSTITITTNILKEIYFAKKNIKIAKADFHSYSLGDFVGFSLINTTQSSDQSFSGISLLYRENNEIVLDDFSYYLPASGNYYLHLTFPQSEYFFKQEKID